MSTPLQINTTKLQELKTKATNLLEAPEQDLMLCITDISMFNNSLNVNNTAGKVYLYQPPSMSIMVDGEEITIEQSTKTIEIPFSNSIIIEENSEITNGILIKGVLNENIKTKRSLYLLSGGEVTNNNGGTIIIYNYENTITTANFQLTCYDSTTLEIEANIGMVHIILPPQTPISFNYRHTCNFMPGFALPDATHQFILLENIL